MVVHHLSHERDLFPKVSIIGGKKQTMGVPIRMDPDDLLDDTTSNGKGEFELFGNEDEVLCIEPYVRITHSCKVSKPGCKRVAEYVVPKDKIGGVYDMTFVTLDIHVDGEKETC
ncbi:unnamed protein product [Heligmosomoides polygyrus]|uniref:Transthyretin-like family protein n=1 Tax=Heligmosomoides polygyrus TaxID=6339 RepID=A0A183GU35_HELPZ|nr:unnamed protein product [Heligmosomoides polygyrus]